VSRTDALRPRRRRGPRINRFRVVSLVLITAVLAGMAFVGVSTISGLRSELASLRSELRELPRDEAGELVSTPRLDPASSIVEYADGGAEAVIDMKTGKRVEITPVDRGKFAIVGSSSMALMASSWKSFADRRGATFYDISTGGWLAEHMLARYGSRPLIADGFTIPASGTVPFTSPNVPYISAQDFTMTGHFEGHEGLTGTVTRAPDGASSWQFTRAASGEQTAVAAGARFIPDVSDEVRDAVTVLNIGKNNLAGTSTPVEDLVKWTVEAYDYATATGKYVLVMGHFVNTDTPADSAIRDRVDAYNAAMEEHFGARFVDVGSYVASERIWDATGISPSDRDREQQALGNKPPSLSAAQGDGVDRLHLNTAGTRALEKLVEDRILVELNWY
jgi:hypothetical protein